MTKFRIVKLSHMLLACGTSGVLLWNSSAERRRVEKDNPAVWDLWVEYRDLLINYQHRGLIVR